MNNLITAIGKERLLPTYPELLDLPNFYLETQLMRLADYFTMIIIEKFFYLSRNFRRVTDESLLDLALKLLFPKKWLQYALQMENKYYYLNIKEVLDVYNREYTFPKILEDRITSVVEFLCFELIQTAVLSRELNYISELTSIDLIKSVKKDPYLYEIVQRNNVILSSTLLKTNYKHLIINGIKLSNKANKLLRLYIETLIYRIIRLAKRKSSKKITVKDVQLIIPLDE